jgi:recombination protein RecA
VKIVKNKVAPPFRVAEFDMMHTDGISFEGDVIDMGLEQKLIARTGAWFRYGDLQLGQGKEKTRQHLKDNPKLALEIKEKILAAGIGKIAKLTAPAPVATESEDNGAIED